MEKKIVFLDIDGTIVDEKKKIPARTKEAVKKLQENGIFVAIATGRSPQHFQDILKELNISSYVSFNGSYVIFNGEIIYTRSLDTTQLLELEREAMKREHPIVFLTENDIYANTPNHPSIHESLGTMNLPHPPFHDSFHHDNDIYQALLFVEEPDDKWYEANIKSFDFVRWHEKCIDILPPGGSKADGIMEMLRKLEIPVESAVAFGDGLNDLEMLELVGYGVAMGNAVPEAKGVADMITDHVADDGLYKGLKKLGLI